jgi:hypothetical protein
MSGGQFVAQLFLSRIARRRRTPIAVVAGDLIDE